MTTKQERERDYERRRYEKRAARLTKAAQRRRRILLRSLVGVGVLVLAVAGVIAVRSNSSATAAASPGASTTSADPTATAGVPDASLAENRTWTGTMTLSQGTLGISLDGAAAPQAVANFTQLAARGFFDDTTCHRLDTSIKILQCGDPTATGTGGPGYTFGPIENAPADGVYRAGTIAMARQANNAASQGSQFFIVYGDTTIPADTAGGYTVIGQVTSGLDVVQNIAAAGTTSGSQTPASPVTIENVETK
ncbi:MAG: peptidylprolyl isomerase [Cellulomonas sp.]|nr:peptidylprolyl isomerase [Cellulomonas sp.]